VRKDRAPGAARGQQSFISWRQYFWSLSRKSLPADCGPKLRMGSQSLLVVTTLNVYAPAFGL
jgi:hypothetical protein